jgi:hypothetical protein
MLFSTDKQIKDFIDILTGAYVHKNDEARQQLKFGLQAFVNEPKCLIQKKLQAFTVSTDLPEILRNVFNVTIQSNNFDMGWEQAFKQVPLAEGQFVWEILDVANSLAFVKVNEGQKIIASGITGSKTHGEVDYYGGALGWTDKSIRARQISSLIDKAETFRNRFWEAKGNIHYALIAAAADLHVTAYDGGTDGQLRRDIRTLNAGMLALANRNLNKGYGNMANAMMILFYNPADDGRIESAFTATSLALQTGNNDTSAQTISKARQVMRIPTFNPSILAGFPVLCLPGQKSQKADLMAPTTYTAPQDILDLNYVQSVWAIYGGILADTDQFEKVTLG